MAESGYRRDAQRLAHAINSTPSFDVDAGGLSATARSRDDCVLWVGYRGQQCRRLLFLPNCVELRKDHRTHGRASSHPSPSSELHEDYKQTGGNDATGSQEAPPSLGAFENGQNPLGVLADEGCFDFLIGTAFPNIASICLRSCSATGDWCMPRFCCQQQGDMNTL
jgi:hypothetical protein